MSYSDLPPLPKSLAAAILPDGMGSMNADTPSTSSSARILPHRETSDNPNRHGSLSSTADSVSSGDASKSPTVSSAGTTSNESNMDTQLATLRQEMHNLRQMDLSLLTQLWALNESIQGFRARLEERKVSRSPSPPMSYCSEADNDFANISTVPPKDSVLSTSRVQSQGSRGGRHMPTAANPRGDALQLTINANRYPEKAARKPRPKKNLYDYPYEENRLKPDHLYQQETCARAQASKTIPQQIYTTNDLPHYPLSKAHTLQSAGGATFHQHLMQKPNHPQHNHSKLHPVQWSPANTQPKASKGAIPKILSILQRKQRAPPPPPPPPPVHKSSQHPV